MNREMAMGLHRTARWCPRLRATEPRQRDHCQWHQGTPVDDDAPVVTVNGASVGGFAVVYRVTVIVGEQAHEWEIRQASAFKELLLWQYQRQRAVRPDRERPAA